MTSAPVATVRFEALMRRTISTLGGSNMAVATKKECEAVNAVADLTASNAVWIAAALLQKGHPDKEGFDRTEIAELARKLSRVSLKTIWQHIDQHCVADRPPNPGRARMLTHVMRGKRRLFKPGDKYHPGREGSPTHPDWTGLPARFRNLEGWYRQWSNADEDPLLALAGLGERVWGNEDAVEHVRELRKGWE